MRRQLLPALRMMIVLTIILGLAYPLAMTGVAQALFKDKADGSLVKADGRVVGSKLLGQEFTSAKYFAGRPSADPGGSAGAMVPVTDPAGNPVAGADGQPKTAPADTSDLSNDLSEASNYGPTNPDFLKLVAQRVQQYRSDNDLPAGTKVPVDAVTASGSGVDPDISVANARLQAPRVAKARNLPLATVLTLVHKHTQHASLGFLGDPGVNVLDLNLALDATR